MTIARTRVWALAVVASFTATRSFSIGLAMCAAVAVWPTERAGAADWPLRGSLAPPTICPVGRMAIRRRSRLGNYEKRFWQQHQPARRLYLAQLRHRKPNSRRRPGQRCRRTRRTAPCSAGISVTTCNGINSSLGVDLGYKYSNIATGANDSISTAVQNVGQFQAHRHIDARAPDEAGRLCDLARARRLCLGPIPALCGGRNRRRSLQLRDDRHGARSRHTNSTCARRSLSISPIGQQRQKQRHCRRRRGAALA